MKEVFSKIYAKPAGRISRGSGKQDVFLSTKIILPACRSFYAGRPATPIGRFRVVSLRNLLHPLKLKRHAGLHLSGSDS